MGWTLMDGSVDTLTKTARKLLPRLHFHSLHNLLKFNQKKILFSPKPWTAGATSPPSPCAGPQPGAYCHCGSQEQARARGWVSLVTVSGLYSQHFIPTESFVNWITILFCKITAKLSDTLNWKFIMRNECLDFFPPSSQVLLVLAQLKQSTVCTYFCCWDVLIEVVCQTAHFKGHSHVKNK